MANKPAGSILLVDEAYIHFAGAPSAADLVAADRDIVILRTFSKLYGMAGLRAGAAFGRPGLLKKIMPYGARALPLTRMVGASASLEVQNLVPQPPKIHHDAPAGGFRILHQNKFKFVPS